MNEPTDEPVKGDTDLDWPEEKPIGTALEDIAKEDTGGPIEVDLEFLAHLFHMEVHGLKRVDLEGAK